MQYYPTMFKVQTVAYTDKNFNDVGFREYVLSVKNKIFCRKRNEKRNRCSELCNIF